MKCKNVKKSVYNSINYEIISMNENLLFIIILGGIMKRSYIVIIVIVLLILLIGGSLIGSYNSLVGLREEVNSQYSNVEVQLERRADLIPNLINTVKGYVKHEDEVIDKITSARENLLKASDISKKAEANEELTNAIDALMVVVENYPDLKANTNFINLQDELAGTENRIAVARRDYNETVKKYNGKIKKVPTNIIAGITGFKEMDYFEADESKKEVPNVEF